MGFERTQVGGAQVAGYWPDIKPAHLHDALCWFERQDRTLGG
jgi:undecaprenyl pyrophosphate synthase